MTFYVFAILKDILVVTGQPYEWGGINFLLLFVILFMEEIYLSLLIFQTLNFLKKIKLMKFNLLSEIL
jgi:hypothetical protein